MPKYLTVTNAKYIEHHIERHYDDYEWGPLKYQEIPASDDYIFARITHCLDLEDSVELETFLLEDYADGDPYHPFWTFEYLGLSTFSSFFRSNLTDIPDCLDRIRSLRRVQNELPLIKLNNYFMRDGKRYFTLKRLNKILTSSRSNKIKHLNNIPSLEFNWKTIFLHMSCMSVSPNSLSYFSYIQDEELPFDKEFQFPIKTTIEGWSSLEWVVKSIKKMLPMFSFYIYKVDKKIFKNTRGKSGKYTFIWKYLAAYKRPFLVMYWLMRELRVAPGRTIQERIDFVISNLLNAPKSTWIWRIKQFSHNYVYYNCRRTLAESYRTVKK